MEGSELLEAIFAAPDDDAPRLVYADWLSQRGDPRGELISLQVAVARADADAVRLRERGRVEARIRALLKAHQAEWTEPLREIADATYTFRRGFVEHVGGYAAADFGAVAGALLDAAPLLRAADVKGHALHSVIMNEASSRFEELVFEDLHPESHLEMEMLLRLLERLRGGALRAIAFETPYITNRRAHEQLATWPDVERFGLSAKRNHGIWFSATFLAQLAAAPHREALRSLRLEGLNLARVEPLPTLFGVESVVIAGCKLGDQYGNLARIVRAMPALRSLAVSTDRLDPAELAEVVEAAPMLRSASLRHLRLETIEPLVAWAPELRRLDLTGNPLGEAAARMLLDAEWPQLIELRFPERLLGDSTRQALRDRFEG